MGNKNEDLITIKNINLSYFNKICYNEEVKKDFVWKIFTIENMKDLEKLSKKVPELKSYCEEIKRLSKDKEYCKMVWNEQIEENLRKAVELEMLEDAKDEGIAKGKAEGKVETKKELVINFFKKKIPIETIADCSNLSISEVKKIVGLN